MNQFTDWDILACIALSLLPLFAFVADGSAKMRFFPKRQKTLDRNRKFDLFDLPSQESGAQQLSYFRHKLTNFRECSATLSLSRSHSRSLNATTFLQSAGEGTKTNKF